jgi:hypothetical protein
MATRKCDSAEFFYRTVKDQRSEIVDEISALVAGSGFIVNDGLDADCPPAKRGPALRREGPRLHRRIQSGWDWAVRAPDIFPEREEHVVFFALFQSRCPSSLLTVGFLSTSSGNRWSPLPGSR